MKHLFWVVPNVLAGRPGPNLEPWDEGDLYAGGIRAVLSVNSGDDVSERELARAGIEYACIPLSANAPPRRGDDKICRRRLVKQFAFVAAHIDRDSPVLVHCRHGRDRTGLFFAYFLMKQNDVRPKKAIAALKHIRPTALTAPGWHDFAVDVLTRMR